MDYTVHEILQARILEWVAFPFSRGSSQPKNRTRVSCIAGRFFTKAIREALIAALNMPANSENSAVFISIPKKGSAKECSSYCTTALISHTSKVMLKIPQARLQQYVNRELSDVQAGLTKGRQTRDQIANIRWIKEKAREFQKNIYFCFIDYAKAFDWITTVENA